MVAQEIYGANLAKTCMNFETPLRVGLNIAVLQYNGQCTTPKAIDASAISQQKLLCHSF